jgi:hypothetical protein
MGYCIAYSSVYTETDPPGVSVNLKSERGSQRVNPAPNSWLLAVGLFQKRSEFVAPVMPIQILAVDHSDRPQKEQWI